jgi:hypothetical protein
MKKGTVEIATFDNKEEHGDSPEQIQGIEAVGFHEL